MVIIIRTVALRKKKNREKDKNIKKKHKIITRSSSILYD